MIPQKQKSRGALATVFFVARFLFDSYRRHWFAAPASAIAAVISTISAATMMLGIAPIFYANFERPTVVVMNAVVAPLLAYLVYLQVYYYGMFRRERSTLLDDSRALDRAKLRAWFRVVKYDYIAHVPTDIYLITLAGMMQATLEGTGTPIFWAVIISQFVDDFITYLKEPAIWNGAKRIVAWEDKSSTTVTRELSQRFFQR